MSAFVYTHTVLPDEIDVLGHANNVAYLGWMQEAALAHSAARGWPGSKYRERGEGFVVRSHTIRYLRPAFAGDELLVRTWVATMRRSSSERRYEIVRAKDARLLATAATEWVFVDYATGAPRRIPPEIAESFTLVDRDGNEAVDRTRTE